MDILLLFLYIVFLDEFGAHTPSISLAFGRG